MYEELGQNATDLGNLGHGTLPGADMLSVIRVVSAENRVPLREDMEEWCKEVDPAS
jgi:hypothetical protein